MNGFFEFVDVRRFDSTFWQKNENCALVPLYGFYSQSVIRDRPVTDLCIRCAPEFARMHDVEVYRRSGNYVRREI